MATVIAHLPPVLNFWSVLYRSDQISASALEQDLQKYLPQLLIFRPWDSPPMCRYYEQEMGAPLERLFAVSLKPLCRSQLVTQKKIALALEQALALKSGQRLINIDPGLVSLENIVLSTAKPYAHRLFLADGIFAELELLFQSGTYRSLEWTYPDYSDPQIIDFFHFLRSYLHNFIRGVEKGLNPS